eukprot:429542_1
MATKYHGQHEYSTFSSSVIRDQREDDKSNCKCSQPSDYFCFPCTISSNLILHPVGPFRCVWDMFVMLLLIYTSIEIPYTLAFGQSINIIYIGLFVDLFLFLDIILNFHTAYFDKYDNLRLVTNKKLICKKYFRTWFLIDFICCIPFSFLLHNPQAATVFKVLRIFRLLRIIKILRFIKMLRIFDAFMK